MLFQTKQFSNFPLVTAASCVLALAVSAQAQPVRPRIVQAIDETRLVTLKGNHDPRARAEFDRGPAPASLPMDRILLVLKRSDQQQADLTRLLQEQHDKLSPNYHKWLTPQEFGERFGPGAQDAQTVVSWLQSHGFQVARVAGGRGIIEFSGDARRVEQAFHTPIHRYVVKGREHWANAADPQIPEALSPVVAGVVSLHNFEPRPQSVVSPDTISATLHPPLPPAITFSNGVHALAPADYGVIYNLNPLYNTGINGSGASIGIVGRSNINLQDIASFRSVFGLPANAPQVIVNGPDPGDLGGNEETEAVLDVSWAGAVAPNASVKFVVSKTTNSTDGVILSEEYIIDNNVADIMSMSFGDCEANYTPSEAAALSALAEQAAAQGITFTVAAGDTGSAGCDAQTETSATGPVSVNILASSPYDIAVGGTQFNQGSNPSQYWSSTNGPGFGSVLSRIPENVWNASSPGSNILATGGGVSSFFPKPSWQTGATGTLNDGARDLPDVSLAASGVAPYALCLRGSCTPNSQGLISLYLVSGTSAATPSFAGMLALVRQNINARLGQANFVLYPLAAAETYSQCNGSTTTQPASSCIFNDITVGNNAVPGEPGYGTPSEQYISTLGYDLASGLGSVNATNLVQQWNSISFTPTTVNLIISPATFPAGTSTNVSIQVLPSSGGGTPTGDTALITSTGVSTSFFTLSGGAVSSTTSQLPAGTYTVRAHYSGDGTFAAADSAPFSITVTTPAVSLTANSLTFAGQPVGTTSIAQSVTLTNTGNGALSISSIVLGGTNAGDFLESNNCGATVLAGANCAISVSFQPTASGTRSASITITDNAAGSPHTITLTGTGQAPIATLSSTSLNFNSVIVGIQSTAQSVKLTNTGTAALSISSLAITGTNAGDFGQTNTCGNSVAAGANCNISVTFTPQAAGSRTASVTITDNASGSPRTIALAGTGVAVGMSAVTVVSTAILGGSSAVGNTVTLTGPAPSGGAVVQLTSSDPSAVVPASVTVAAGATLSPTFTITTSVVAAPITVTITGTYNGTSKTDTLVVNPLTVSTLIVSPASVIGGISAAGNKVVLNGAAPSGGAVVTLSSDTPSVGAVPASVTVAAGLTTSPAFTITTTAVTAATSVTVTATYNGVSQQAILTVNPAALSSVSLSPSSLIGGISAANNKVVLTGIAPAGGAVVMLTSDTPSVGAVPASVTVAAGQTVSPVFTITTAAVTTTTSVTVTATYNGVSKQAVLTVNPATLSLVTTAASVVGGSSAVNNTVTLTGIAPAGGAVVQLTSSDPSAVVPASVTVAAGATKSPAFTVTTSVVAAPVSVTISATYAGITKTSTLVVNPLTVSSITLSPTSVIGGVSAAGNKVVLNGAAPSGGAVVTLSSNTPSVGAVPASVTVAAGQFSSPAFTITTTAVTSPTSVTVTATYNGISQQAILTVNPAALSSLSVVATSVMGGNSAAGNTVALTGIAPAGGAAVQLSSSDPSAVVPASVTVAAGATVSPAFTITTSVVSAPVTVTITATYNGTSKTDTLVVNPLGVSSVTLSPASVVGGVSATANKVVLTGAAPAGGAVVTLSSGTPSVAAVPASVTVAAGQTVSAAFTITTSAVTATTPVTVTATYNGVSQQATLTVTPAALSSVSLSPASVVGGVSATNNKVVLTGVAPPTGVLVTLTSDTPSVAAVPSSVTVAGGQTISPAFTITTSAVTTTTSVTVTATYNGLSKQAVLTVNPAALSAVTTAASVIGGTPVAGNTVTLTGFAPSGGATVQLTSSDPSAVVPSQAIVAAGTTTSPAFTITTSVVAAPVTVTITATYAGISKTHTLVVNPLVVTSVTLSPASLIGGVSAANNKIVLNGVAPSTGAVVTLSSDTPSVGAVPASVTVAAGQLVSPAFPITTTAVTAVTSVTVTATYNGVSKQAILTVNPATLSALTLSPTSTVGSVSTFNNKVLLTGIAPSGGATVTLSSDTTAVGAVPASITIPAGSATSAAFTITTTAVSAPTSVTITATYNGVSKQAVLTVNPITVSLLTLSPASVTGGSSTTANKVVLTAAAPFGGAVITLSSDTPSVAAVPASIAIPAGSTTSTVFTITTTAVSAPTSVTVTATYNGVSKQAVLTVNP